MRDRKLRFNLSLSIAIALISYLAKMIAIIAVTMFDSECIRRGCAEKLPSTFSLWKDCGVILTYVTAAFCGVIEYVQRRQRPFKRK